MAALDNITLLTPDVLISLFVSPNEFSSNGVMQFGVIEKIFSGCTRLTEGDFVIFKKSEELIESEGVQYFICDEMNVKSKETAP